MIWLLLALLLVASPVRAAVVFDAVGTEQNAVSTSANIPITIGAGPNTAIVVGFAAGTNTTNIACTVGGETLTIIPGSDGGATTATVLLGKATNLTGAQTVACTWLTNQNAALNAMTFTGVHQASPFNGGTFGTGASPFATTIKSSPGDMTTTVDGTDGTGNAVTNQTSKWGSGTMQGGDIGPGTGTTTHTWSGGTTEFMSGANIVQSETPQRTLTGVGR